MRDIINQMRLTLFFLLFLFSSPLQAADNSTNDPVRIGAIYSLTGFGAVGGYSELNAVLMAVEEINQQGGIAGRPVELFYEDNQSDMKKSVSAFRKLLSIDKIDVLLGPNWAEFSEVVAPIAQQNEIPMITASGYKDGLTIGKDYVFTLLPRHIEAVRPFARYVLEHHSGKTALLTTHNAFYESISNGFLEVMKESKKPIWKQFSFGPEETDFRPMLLKLKANKVDTIVAFLLEGKATTQFLEQARNLKFDISKILFGPSIAYDHLILENKSIANGVVYFDYIDQSDEKFQQKFRSKYESHPLVGSGKSYDSLFMLKKIIEECGIESSKIKECLSSVEYQGVSGKIRFDSDGNFAGDINVTRIFRVEDGEFKIIG